MATIKIREKMKTGTFRRVTYEVDGQIKFWERPLTSSFETMIKEIEASESGSKQEVAASDAASSEEPEKDDVEEEAETERRAAARAERRTSRTRRKSRKEAEKEPEVESTDEETERVDASENAETLSVRRPLSSAPPCRREWMPLPCRWRNCLS